MNLATGDAEVAPVETRWLPHVNSNDNLDNDLVTQHPPPQVRMSKQTRIQSPEHLIANSRATARENRREVGDIAPRSSMISWTHISKPLTNPKEQSHIIIWENVRERESQDTMFEDTKAKIACIASSKFILKV